MDTINEGCRWLALFDPYSELYAVWRGSLVDELVEHGYSVARAKQVIDKMTNRARRQ